MVGLGRSKELLLREIAAIKELLQEQPDSKCEPAFHWLRIAYHYQSPIGCLESIVHCQGLLLKHWPRDVDVTQITEDRVSLLKQLEELDPMRSMRYKELCEWVGFDWFDIH
jgi:geranylgeranyl transferase type-2 subunit alpha